MERVLAALEILLLAMVIKGGFLPTHEPCDLDLSLGTCACHVRFSETWITCKSLGLVEWPDLSALGNITIGSLDISENWLHHIPSDAFGRIEVYRIVLRGNYRSFDYDPDVFNEIQRHSLRSLDLRDNALEELPEFVSDLGSLETLWLTGNHFREIRSTDLTGLPNLHEIHLPVLTSISRNTLAATESLRLLEISPVSSDPTRKSIKQFFGAKLTAKLRHLETLILSHGRVGLKNDFLASLAHLQHLEISSCQIQNGVLPTDLQLTWVIVISLANNLLDNVPRGFIGQAHSMTHLDLSRNWIETLDKRDFHDNKQLEHIDLSHNHIQTIKRSTFSELSHLHILDLSYNNINKLHPEIFPQPFTSGLRLYLGSNPFRCRCNIWWLAQLARSQVEGHPGPLEPYEASQLTCDRHMIHSAAYDMLKDTCQSAVNWTPIEEW